MSNDLWLGGGQVQTEDIFQLIYIVERCKYYPFVNPGYPRSIAAAPPPAHRMDLLADFSTDRRVLLLCLLALPIGAIGAVVAEVLLWVIVVITNAAYFLRWSSVPVTPATNHLGWWAIIVPVIGSLLIGLMARYG